MLGLPLLIAIAVAVLGSLGVAKCEHSRADAAAELAKTKDATIAELRGQVDDRDARIKSANKETDKANALLLDLATKSQNRVAAARAATAKAQESAAASASREAQILNAPRTNPNACQSACNELRAPL